MWRTSASRRDGPIALLPMSEGRCGLVWTLAPDDAARCSHCRTTPSSSRELQDAFGFRLGRFMRVGDATVYPLALTRADEHIGAATRHRRQRRAGAASDRRSGLQSRPARRREPCRSPRRRRCVGRRCVDRRRWRRCSTLSRVARRRSPQHRRVHRWAGAAVRAAARAGAQACASVGMLAFDLAAGGEGCAGAAQRRRGRTRAATRPRRRPGARPAVTAQHDRFRHRRSSAAAWSARASRRWRRATNVSRDCASHCSSQPRLRRREPGDVDLRVSALSRASQRILDAVGAWEPIARSTLAPYRRHDRLGRGQHGHDAPDALHFSAGATSEPNLGHIVENRRVQWALHDSPPLRAGHAARAASSPSSSSTQDQRDAQLADGRTAASGAGGRLPTAAHRSPASSRGSSARVGLRPARLRDARAHRAAARANGLAAVSAGRSDRVPAAARRPHLDRLDARTRGGAASLATRRGGVQPSESPRRCDRRAGPGRACERRAAFPLRSGMRASTAGRVSRWSAMRRTRSIRWRGRASNLGLARLRALVRCWPAQWPPARTGPACGVLRRYERWRKQRERAGARPDRRPEPAVRHEQSGGGRAAADRPGPGRRSSRWLRRALIERALGVRWRHAAASCVAPRERSVTHRSRRRRRGSATSTATIVLLGSWLRRTLADCASARFEAGAR